MMTDVVMESWVYLYKAIFTWLKNNEKLIWHSSVCVHNGMLEEQATTTIPSAAQHLSKLRIQRAVRVYRCFVKK